MAKIKFYRGEYLLLSMAHPNVQHKKFAVCLISLKSIEEGCNGERYMLLVTSSIMTGLVVG